MLPNTKSCHLARYILLLAIGFFACNKENVRLEENFYPIKTGNSITYKIEETTYSVTEKPVSKYYFLKETIGSEIDTVNHIFTLERYLSNNFDGIYRLDSVWQIQAKPDKIIRYENNNSFIKLIIPVDVNSEWHPNSKSEELSKITKKYISEENLFLDIHLKNDSSLIAVNRNLETYQNNLGLVYKLQENLANCQESSDCIGKGIISYGSRKKMTVYKTNI